MAEPTVNLPDVPALPGPAQSWSPSDDKTRADVTGKLAAVQGEKVAAADKIYGEIEGTQARLLPRIEQLSKDAGVEAEKMKPWDADAEAAKRRTDPIEAFGSLGSVFGILASAFTHAPMENALNASAAAMNAIRQGDEKSYDKAYKAWEANTKMALDRHKIQHDAYQDAISLLSVNTQAANTKLAVLAARFGDKKMQALLDAGMSSEILEYATATNKVATQIAEDTPKRAIAHAEMASLMAPRRDPKTGRTVKYDSKNPATEDSLLAFSLYKQEQIDQKAAERAYTPEQQAYAQFVKSKPDATPEERAEYIQSLRRRKDLTPEQQAVNAFMEQNPDATAEQLRDYVTNLRRESRGGAGAANLTTDRQRAQDVAAFRQKLRAEENEDGTPKYKPEEIAQKAAEYEKSLKMSATAPSGNRMDELAGKINRVEYAESTIDKVEELLKKHKAITGLGGTVTRPAEVIGNIFGSNETDRAQFRRYISELQEWAPRILTDSNGRPLSAEAGKVANIIAGLGIGDTTANTARAYAELRPLLKRIKEDLAKRRGGAPESSAPPAAAKKPPWMDWPEVK